MNMGLGPPVCTKCMVVGTLNDHAKEHPWQCPVCRDWDMKGSLFTYVKSLQEIIWKRTRFAKIADSKDKKFSHIYTAKRPFMVNGNPEPNDYYRPWLECNIGKQGVDWEWDLSPTDLDMLEIYFTSKEYATIFELRWP